MTLPFDLRNGFEMNAIKFQVTTLLPLNLTRHKLTPPLTGHNVAPHHSNNSLLLPPLNTPGVPSRFIEENHAHKQSSRGRSDRRQDLMSFWGYKFEALSTLPSNWDDCSREQIENRDKEIVSNEAQFCSIVKTGFADVKIVIGGEVDAGTSPFSHPYL